MVPQTRPEVLTTWTLPRAAWVSSHVAAGPTGRAGGEGEAKGSTPFKTVLEAICHILFIRSKSLSPAHTQGLWTSSKPSLTPTSLPGRFWVLLSQCSAVIPLPAAALMTASARALPCKLLEERS